MRERSEPSTPGTQPLRLGRGFGESQHAISSPNPSRRRQDMTRFHAVMLVAGLALLGVVALTLAPAIGQAPKYGGILNVMQREDPPQGFSIHETSTISTVWPGMPCLSNLVIFDPLKKTESMETIIPELAEKWSWQDNYRNLVFFLRKNVKWHDGQPFTSKDVKYTFDMVREAKEAQAKLRINPRKDWYANVDNIEAADPHTVVFHLKRPQPSLIMMLASGYSPVYAEASIMRRE